VLGLAAAGCGQVGMLKGRMAFREATNAYKAQDYRLAAEKYEETINECRGTASDCTDPDLDAAYFYLANSYDNLYRPARRGEAANDELLQKAIANYQRSAEIDNDDRIKQLAMEYLVNAYGPDKLNDPAQAEPILLRMIESNPKEVNNYFGLANIYEQSGDYERAEQMLLKARDERPNAPEVYMQLAGFYNRQGEFDKTMEALHARAQQEPNNPEAYYTIATYYWEKAYRDFTTPQAQKLEYYNEGIEAVDKAIELKADYVDALIYKGLLLRGQATVEKDPARQQALLREAATYQDRAVEVKKKQQASSAGD
jgi:tetratricopeptide (TPR) repeat protein